MEVELTEMNEILLEVYDQMVMLEKLLRDLTMVFKEHAEGMESLDSAIRYAVAEMIG